MTAFDDLNRWYQAQCDGDWEHRYGISIETLDNPGWWVRIDLRDTLLEESPFIPFVSGDGGEDIRWISCKVEEAQWHGMGDPSRLEELIGHFVAWARTCNDWLAVPDDATLLQRDDRELWAHLGKHVGDSPCMFEQCDHLRVSNSVYCRIHHWQRVLGRPYPFVEDVA